MTPRSYHHQVWRAGLLKLLDMCHKNCKKTQNMPSTGFLTFTSNTFLSPTTENKHPRKIDWARKARLNLFLPSEGTSERRAFKGRLESAHRAIRLGRFMELNLNFTAKAIAKKRVGRIELFFLPLAYPIHVLKYACRSDGCLQFDLVLFHVVSYFLYLFFVAPSRIVHAFVLYRIRWHV